MRTQTWSHLSTQEFPWTRIYGVHGDAVTFSSSWNSSSITWADFLMYCLSAGRTAAFVSCFLSGSLQYPYLRPPSYHGLFLPSQFSMAVFIISFYHFTGSLFPTVPQLNLLDFAFNVLSGLYPDVHYQKSAPESKKMPQCSLSLSLEFSFSSYIGRP